MYLSSRATKQNRPDWEAYITEFSYSSGGWKSPIKMLAGLVSPEASLLDLQLASFSLCPLHDLSLRPCTPAVSFSSYEDSSPIGLGLIL